MYNIFQNLPFKLAFTVIPFEKEVPPSVDVTIKPVLETATKYNEPWAVVNVATCPKVKGTMAFPT